MSERASHPSHRAGREPRRSEGARAAPGALAVAVVLSLATALGSGCYYAQAVRGQMGVLWGRVPLARALAEGSDLSPAERELLAQTPYVLRFAEERLGLTPDGSYRTFYDTGAQPISWNVTACRCTRFEPFLWTFPFVGAAPYKGYFRRADAEREAERLRAEGWDARVSEVPAYSTLGWFEDPVFRSMLRGGRYDYVATLIHETLHATIFRPGDAPFNESMATFVGEEGALAYLAERHGEASPEVAKARAERHDARVFQRFMAELYLDLDRLYRREDLSEEQKLAQREGRFAAARERFERVRAERMRDPQSYAGLARMTLDNCFVMLFRTYNTELDAFAQVHRLTGGAWPETLAVFRQAAEAEEPFAFLAAWRRARWLERLAPVGEAWAR